MDRLFTRRITDDFRDIWPLLYNMFERCEKWAEHAGRGHWPDCDMLPLGHIGIRSVDGGATDRWTRFTKEEQRTMMTLWSIVKSPLMFGGELRDNDEWRLPLLTNPDVLHMLWTSSNAHQVYRQEDQVVWSADAEEGSLYVALFNLSDEAADISVSLEDLGLFRINS